MKVDPASENDNNVNTDNIVINEVPTLSLTIKAGRKYAAIETKIAEIREAAQTEREKIDYWEKEEIERLKTQQEWAVYTLDAYARTCVKENKKRKTVNLPDVTVSFKKQPPQYEKDELTLLKWCQSSAPEMVENIPSLLWGKLKTVAHVVDDKLVSPDGEVIPGVKVTFPPDKMHIKPIKLAK